MNKFFLFLLSSELGFTFKDIHFWKPNIKTYDVAYFQFSRYVCLDLAHTIVTSSMVYYGLPVFCIIDTSNIQNFARHIGQVHFDASHVSGMDSSNRDANQRAIQSAHHMGRQEHLVQAWSGSLCTFGSSTHSFCNFTFAIVCIHPIQDSSSYKKISYSTVSWYFI